jgi:hypothetical protein
LKWLKVTPFVVPQSVMHGDQPRSPFVSIIKKVGLIFNEGKKSIYGVQGGGGEIMSILVEVKKTLVQVVK